MPAEKIIGIIAIVLGLLLALASRRISKGAAEFYRRFYTAKNLRIMFIIAGLFLVFIGIVILVSA